MVSRLEIIETGRRRRWTEAEKLRIVGESFSGSRLVSATARRHGISRSLLTTWRKAFRQGEPGAAPMFAPVMVRPEPRPQPVPAARPEERVEIVLGNGRRMLVRTDVDAAALARLVAVLERA